MIIRQSMYIYIHIYIYMYIYILSIITREIGKLKTHSLTYCIMDNCENMPYLIHTLDKLYLTGILWVQCLQRIFLTSTHHVSALLLFGPLCSPFRPQDILTINSNPLFTVSDYWLWVCEYKYIVHAFGYILDVILRIRRINVNQLISL